MEVILEDLHKVDRFQATTEHNTHVFTLPPIHIQTLPYPWPTLIARFMGPTWGPSGADRTQVGPMLAPWTLLSGRPHLACTTIPLCKMHTTNLQDTPNATKNRKYLSRNSFRFRWINVCVWECVWVSVFYLRICDKDLCTDVVRIVYVL